MTSVHIYSLESDSKKQSKKLLINNLSLYLDRDVVPQDIWRNENGKPYIKDIFFSVSHSKNSLVQIFSTSNPVGIDVEFINPKRNYMALAKRYFHQQEFQYLNLLDPKESLIMFYNLWSRKEALCKAQGGRLWYYLQDNYLNKQQMATNIKGFELIQLDTIPDFSLVIATEKKDADINIIHE